MAASDDMPRRGCVACCSYPNGCISVVPSIMSIVGVCLSSAAWMTCHFAKVKIEGSDYLSFDIGLFSREKFFVEVSTTLTFYDDDFVRNYACVGYSDYEVHAVHDSSFKAAQAFGVLAGFGGFVLMIVAWVVSPCLAVPRIAWRVNGVLFLLVGLCQVMTLLALGSRTCKTCVLGTNDCTSTCSLTTGGSIAIAATLLWFATGASCFAIPDPAGPLQQHFSTPPSATQVQQEIPVATAQGEPFPMATETTTQHVDPNGTTVIETVAANADGTTIATKTLVPPDKSSKALE